MSTDTPIADAIHARTKGGVYEENYIDALGSVRELERENARLREEVEMLNVRHAAAMLHAQTHADEYNALQEELSLANGTIESRDRNIATLQDELAEAKVCISNQESMLNGKHEYVGQDFKMRMQKLTQRAEQAEARALAAEKDDEIGKAVNRAAAELPDGVDLEIALERGAGTVRLYLPDSDAAITDFGSDLSFHAEINAAIDAAIGAKHD